jgi:hypothetical protein
MPKARSKTAQATGNTPWSGLPVYDPTFQSIYPGVRLFHPTYGRGMVIAAHSRKGLLDGTPATYRYAVTLSLDRAKTLDANHYINAEAFKAEGWTVFDEGLEILA